MLDISTELKELYKSNNVPKYYDIYIPLLDLHINSHGTNDKIVHGSFELKESLCSDKDLRFGSCEASEIKFVVADISHDLKGQEITIDQYISEHVVPFGKYKIDSCKKQDDLRYKEIIAYDKLADIDIDVSEWYNSLFPTGVETYTLKKFRSLLLAHLGIEEIDQTLPNDDMVVEKTIDPTQISGRDVLKATVELNGAFGHINRQGKFVRKILQPSYGLYPSETLYPSEDLYPVAETDTSYVQEDIIADTINKAMYESVRFEEYTVKEIDKLIIRAEEDDIGEIVGTGSNAYIIQGNFLVFGKTADELKGIASNILGNMAKRPYRPFKSEGIGLPYVEVGDSLEFATNEPVTGYVLQRTLTGIQALRDEYTAEGNEKREQNFGLNTEVINLKRRAAIIKKNVDEVSVDLSDLEQNVNTSLEITHGEIALKVDKAGVIGAINLSHEEAKISASKINLYGYVTVNDLAGEGSTIINGSNITTGTIDASVVNVINLNADNITSGTIVADSVKSSWVYTGSINANQITAGSISGDRISGGTISGSSFHSSGSYGSSEIRNGRIYTEDIYVGVGSSASTFINLYPSFIHFGSSSGYLTISAGSISGLTSLNGSTPLTSSNAYTSQITASNTGYGNIDFKGFDNAAGVNWVQANFAPKTSSDVRLKYDIHTLDSIPNELFMSLKPKQFRFKTDKDGKGIYFGLIAQELENAFSSHGLNPYDYAIIELEDVRNYTDDGMYVDGETHRINYINFIPWMVKIIQEQNDRIIFLEDAVHNQNERISILEEKLYNS